MNDHQLERDARDPAEAVAFGCWGSDEPAATDASVMDVGGNDAVPISFFDPGKTVRIDAKRIRPSRFANRLEFNWEGRAFKEFKEGIESDGGNQLPILVRPVAVPVDQVEFEIAYGHRRHRACLETGMQVLAIVDNLTDQELVKAMMRENKRRRDCSPYERGLQYKLLLDQRLYSSARELAEASCEKDHSLISRLIKLAALPEEVVKAFRSPADLQVKWGALLDKALKEDSAGVKERARQITAAGAPKDARQVLASLLSAKAQVSQPLCQTIPLKRADKIFARITVPHASCGAGIKVDFEPGAVDADSLREALFKLLDC